MVRIRIEKYKAVVRIRIEKYKAGEFALKARAILFFLTLAPPFNH